MKKDQRVLFLRENNQEKVLKILEEKSKFTFLSEYAEFLDMRTYFKVNNLGNINIKEYNPLLIIFTFCDDKNKLSKDFLKYTFPEEKHLIRKIERASNLNIDNLKENLMKTLVSGNLNFSKIFAKELYLKDKKEFFSILYTFSMMGNPKDIKLIFVYSLEKIFENIEYNEKLFYVALAYLSKKRDDYFYYQQIKQKDLKLVEVENKNINNEDKEIYLEIFNRVNRNYRLKNKEYFIASLNKYFEEEFLLNKDLKVVFKEKLKKGNLK